MDTDKLSANNDFYQYVNDEWLSHFSHQIPDDYSSWGGFTKLHDDGLRNQINIVKGLENNRDTEEKKKINAIWKASEDRFSSWRKGTSDYKPIIQELNILDKHFETFSDGKTIHSRNYISCLSKYLHYTQINGISNVIDFDTGSDLKNVNNVVLDFSVGGLSLPSPEYYKSDKFEDKRQLFKDHLTKIKNILEDSYVSLNSGFVDNVLEFEHMIADFTMAPDQSREYGKYYTNTTLDEIYKNMNDLNSLPRKQENYEENERDFKLTKSMISDVGELFESMYNHFNLRDVMATNFTKNFSTEKIMRPKQYHITAYDGDGIRRCMKLILDSDNYEKYKSYMQYQIISNFQGFCTKALNEEFFDFYSRKLGGQEKQKPDEKRSISVVNAYAGEMMGKLFVERYFPEKSKVEMEMLVKNVLNTTDHSLRTNNWLTNETKEKAVDKLDNFRSKIGYPNKWKDYSDFDIELGDSLYDIYKKAKKWSLRVNFFEKINSVLDRDEWRMTPQTVNAYFMPTQNEIVFPAAILQPPFFHQTKETVDFDIQEELEMCPDLDVVTIANYGGIGAVIAHEITHGYDDKGREFDKNGNLNNWWKDEDKNMFKEKTEIMVKCVEKYVFEDNGTKYKMNPQLTMGENLADIGGLSLSMKALLNILSGADALTIKASLRVFFKSWANVWKQNTKKDKRIMALNVDPHAPTDFRGNLVQHMDEFYDVFNIVKGDKMYLEKKDRMVMW